ncbi:MAG: CrcB family protein [Planctomycetia bacterium]
MTARPDLVAWLGVAAGGALGSLARAALQGVLSRPWGTLAANLGGSLAMGLLLGLDLGTRAKAFLAVGVLGGFTTLSGIGMDAWLAWQDGERSTLALYLAWTLLGSALALLAGLFAARAWLA